jgi:hypothetical protein
MLLFSGHSRLLVSTLALLEVCRLTLFASSRMTTSLSFQMLCVP